MKLPKNTAEELALKTFTKLIRAAETVAAEVHSGLANHNITVSQFGILEALFHLGPMCQRDLAVKILKSTGNITLVIDNLEKRNLVKRLRDEDDRRFFTIHLTPAGKRFIEEIFPAHAARIVAKMAVLSEQEQVMLGDCCRKFKQLQTD